ncbi:hypothetical protein LMG10661_03349 [Ralstonia syzygii subsp. syzygii]|nr:hypothetical protein LMG10661_03349 [Ralstonia syzygii subsp. syzygii]
MLKHLLKLLRGKKDTQESVAANFRIDITESTPEPTPVAVAEKKPRRKRRTKEEMAIARAELVEKMRVEGLERAVREKAQQTAIGVEHYIWRGNVCDCPACEANDGKRFRWDKPPRTGHPGECTSCNDGYCKCYAEAIIPGFDSN